MTDAEVIRRHYYALLEARKCNDTGHRSWALGWLSIAADWRWMLQTRRHAEHKHQLRKVA